MNVSNVSSATCACQSHPAGVKQRFQDFKALSDALQSGDLTAAQSALAAFQKDLQKPSQAGRTGLPFGQNSQAAKDLQALQDALQSGDVSAAQQAFADLKRGIRGAGHAHHHQQVENKTDGDADDHVTGSDSTSTSTDSDAPAAPGAALDVQA